MIEVSKLTRRFGAIEALSELSFSVQSGKIVGLLGRNGAGKTTTLRILSTIIPPSSGQVLVGGVDAAKDAFAVRNLIGYLPELPALIPELRVSGYLQFMANLRGVNPSKPAVDTVIEQCGLTNVYSTLCANLSRGYRQRVGLAQALIHHPKILILDEPTSGLDPAQVIEVRQLIAKLAGEQTVLLSTHTLSEVVELCSKVLIIAAGRLVAEQAVDEQTSLQAIERLFMEAVQAGR